MCAILTLKGVRKVTKKKLHEKVHRIYKILLGIIAIVVILIVPAKVPMLILTILWMFEPEIEDMIENFIRKRK